MTKTLTENRWFYTENGIKDASWNIVLKSEVLAPVPSYKDYKGLMYDRIELDKAKIKIYELVSKTEQLEKRLEVSEKEHYRTLEQLRIATGALRETREKLLHVELSGLDGDNRQKMYDLMFEDGVIDKALKEMEGVK